MRCVHPALASRLLAVFPDSFDGALLMKLSRPFLVVLALFCAFGLMFAPTVWASPTASIAGSVKDPSGAVISSAKLTLVNIATNAKVDTASDSNGAFQFLQLTPAVYSLNVEADGFKKLVMEGIVEEVDQITHVEATLQVGSVSQTVEVSGGAIPLLENDRSTLSNVVESEVISNMPLNARQYLDLALLTPGVLPSAAGTQGGGFNVAGARSQSNVFLLDGVSNIDTQINSALGNFRITDAVQEFAVQTSGHCGVWARHGRSGEHCYQKRHEPFSRNRVRVSAQFGAGRGRFLHQQEPRNEESTAPQPVWRYAWWTNPQGHDVLLSVL